MGQISNKELYEAIQHTESVIKEELKGYVRHEEFEPIKNYVNLILTAIILAVLGGLMAMVVRS